MSPRIAYWMVRQNNPAFRALTGPWQGQPWIPSGEGVEERLSTDGRKLHAFFYEDGEAAVQVYEPDGSFKEYNA
jgi:hypothetical protein